MTNYSDPLNLPDNKKVPDYYNPHNIIQNTDIDDSSLLSHEAPETPPEEILKKKYPIKVIAGFVLLVVSVLAIPVAVYLNQRPTRVFIEATATPSATPTPTPSTTPTEILDFNS